MTKEEILQEEITLETLENRIFKLGSREYTNEESTKQGLIIPYLSLLDVDAKNVSILSPEYTVNFQGNFYYKQSTPSDIAKIKKSKKESDEDEELKVGDYLGKVDYALNIGNCLHFIEAKRLDKNMLPFIKQLKMYMDNDTKAELGILTDGNHYLYFDVDAKGFMIEKPFLCYSLINNFRNDRVKFFTELYRITRFNADYIHTQLENMDTTFINQYNKIISTYNTYKTEGIIKTSESIVLDKLLNK